MIPLNKLALAFGVVAGLTWVSAVAAGASTSRESMMALSNSMRELSDCLDRGDLAAARAHAQQFARAARIPPSLRPQVNADLEADFQELGDGLKTLAEELSRLVSSGNVDSVGPVLRDIRGTCVTCHVKFRSENDRRGLYPGQQNTVAGQVQVTEPGGEIKADASNVVVFLDGMGGNRTFSPPRVDPRISQKNRVFAPRVLPVLRGASVEFPNDDNIFHNVFSLSKAHPFDFGIYREGTSRSVTLRKSGLIKVYCNIHPDMAAYVLVLNNPYFSVTDRKGHFVLPEVPDGRYELRAWQELGEETRQEITISGGRLHSLDLEIREERKSIQHRNKFGKHYKDKY